MTATAVVSADRRYVRITPSPLFSGVTQVQTFNFVTGQEQTMPGGGVGTGTGAGGVGGTGERAVWEEEQVVAADWAARVEVVASCNRLHPLQPRPDRQVKIVKLTAFVSLPSNRSQDRIVRAQGERCDQKFRSRRRGHFGQTFP